MERSRFSEAMMWSVEVGIQRRTLGHKDFDDVFVTTVDVEVVAAVAAAAAAVAAADNSSDMVASKFDHLWRWGRRKLMRFRIEILIVRMKFNRAYIGAGNR